MAKRTITKDRTAGGVLTFGKGGVLPTSRSKYGNIWTEVDGRKFQSKHEANRYMGLRLLERAGEIADLECQVPYRLEVNGHLIATYIADFVYLDIRTNSIIVEDAKSEATRKIPEYRMKRKLMLALHNVNIIEV